MTTQFRTQNGTWRVASTERLEPGTHVSVTRRNGQVSQVIIREYIAWDPGRELPYLYAFEDVRSASGAQPEDRLAHVGNSGRLFALFERANHAATTPNHAANGHARNIAVRFPLTNTGRGLRLEMAGASSRYAGRLLALSDERNGRGARSLYGSLASDGAFIGRVGSTTIELEIFNEVADVLTRFAADPAGYAAAHGHATGNCCFCGRGLTDERSVTVGYGPICADYFGLPWGDATAPAFDVAQGSRRQMERMADNIGRENAFDHLPPATPIIDDPQGRYLNAQGEIINRTLYGIETGSGEQLDRWGAQYGVRRIVQVSGTEDDASYRLRILDVMRRMAQPDDMDTSMPTPMPTPPDEVASYSVPTLEDIQNEPNGMRRMAMAVARASAELHNVHRDSLGRVVVADIRDDRTIMGTVEQPVHAGDPVVVHRGERVDFVNNVQLDPDDHTRITATMTVPVREGRLVHTVRRVRVERQAPAAPAAPAGAWARRARGIDPTVERSVPTDETTTSVVRRPRRTQATRPLEEDDFVWPPRNT